MKLGFNLQTLVSTPDYEAILASVAWWAQVIRLDNHMGAYGWRVDPHAVYDAAGNGPIKTYTTIAERLKKHNFQVDFIRDGYPPAASDHWNALPNTDWSSFVDGDWREYQTPKGAWGKSNTWTNVMAKLLKDSGLKTRWQPMNESFMRGKDQWAYERLKNVYAQPSYGSEWTSPVLFGKQHELIEQLEEWAILHKYDKSLTKAKTIAINVYPDWVGGETEKFTPADWLHRAKTNLYMVNDWAVFNGFKLVIPEFAFWKDGIPDVDQRIEYTADVFRFAMTLPAIDTLCLYWTYDPNDQYYLSLDQLAKLSSAMATATA